MQILAAPTLQTFRVLPQEQMPVTSTQKLGDPGKFWKQQCKTDLVGAQMSIAAVCKQLAFVELCRISQSFAASGAL